jgi:hypothetical protein
MIRFYLYSGTLLMLSPAWACSCSPLPETGFVHADLNRLPANARGALFLAKDDKLKATAFYISSNAQAGPLKAELSWPDLGVKGKHNAIWPAWRRSAASSLERTTQSAT